MKFKNRIFLVMFLTPFLFGVNETRSQELANYSSSFTNVGFGARPLGMGGAYTALTHDVHGILWNPAGIIEVEQFEATLTYAKQFGLVPYSFGGLVYRFTPGLSLGGGIIVSGDELMRETTLISNIATRFYVDDYLLNIGLSVSLLNALFGKYENSDGAVSGDALGFSVGFGAQLYMTEKIILATHFQNFLNTVEWNSSASGKYSEELPQKWTIGIGLQDYHQFNFDLDFQKSLYKDLDDQFFVGAEKVMAGKIFLRAGAASSINQSERLYYSFGGGFYQKFRENKNFQLDFAYIVHQLANMFRISLTFSVD